MTDLRIIQVTLCNGAIQDENHCSRIQNVLKAAPVISFQWCAIGNFVIAPRAVLVVPGKNDFIHICFDYETSHNPMAAVRVSERVKTTVFKEKFSYS